MTNLRTAISALMVALLALGSALAAMAALGGTAGDWAAKADSAPIRSLALAFLVASIALAFVSDPTEDGREPEE